MSNSLQEYLDEIVWLMMKGVRQDEQVVPADIKTKLNLTCLFVKKYFWVSCLGFAPFDEWKKVSDSCCSISGGEIMLVTILLRSLSYTSFPL